MKQKAIRLSDMMRWWNHNGNFNTDLYIRICKIKSKK